MCKKLIKNSQPFWKKFQKTVGGDFFWLTLYMYGLCSVRSDTGQRLQVTQPHRAVPALTPCSHYQWSDGSARRSAQTDQSSVSHPWSGKLRPRVHWLPLLLSDTVDCKLSKQYQVSHSQPRPGFTPSRTFLNCWNSTPDLSSSLSQILSSIVTFIPSRISTCTELEGHWRLFVLVSSFYIFFWLCVLD